MKINLSRLTTEMILRAYSALQWITSHSDTDEKIPVELDGIWEEAAKVCFGVINEVEVMLEGADFRVPDFFHGDLDSATYDHRTLQDSINAAHRYMTHLNNFYVNCKEFNSVSSKTRLDLLKEWMLGDLDNMKRGFRQVEYIFLMNNTPAGVSTADTTSILDKGKPAGIKRNSPSKFPF